MYGRSPWCLRRHYQHIRRFCTCKIPYKKMLREQLKNENVKLFNENDVNDSNSNKINLLLNPFSCNLKISFLNSVKYINNFPSFTR